MPANGDHRKAPAGMLATLDIDKTWKAATEVERRVLVDEFIEEEVGMKDSGFDRVGGPKDAKPDWRLQPWGQGE